MSVATGLHRRRYGVLAHYLATQDGWSRWAYECLSELAAADPLRALWVIRRVLETVDDNDQIEWFGAAQVEETVGSVGARLVNGDAEPFEELKAFAQENERLRRALATVWVDLDGTDPPEMWAGIDEILGTTYAERHAAPGTT
jgi:hypothetical protein